MNIASTAQLPEFSRLHAGIITSFKLINIPEAAHENPFKCDMGQASRDAIFIIFICFTVQESKRL